MRGCCTLSGLWELQHMPLHMGWPFRINLYDNNMRWWSKTPNPVRPPYPKHAVTVYGTGMHDMIDFTIFPKSWSNLQLLTDRMSI